MKQTAYPPAFTFRDPAPKRYELTARASQIDPRTRPHPEIGFVFEKDGKPQDTERAWVDTRVAPRGKLVVWLMGFSSALFERLNSYGIHAIQVHYANGWFGQFGEKAPPGDDKFLGKIRLEAATGEDVSAVVDIPKPDSIKERAYQFVRWLAKENPEGNWGYFLTDDQSGLRWDRVILSGISHGSTTAARFAKAQRVDRVVMFSGPRDQTETWQALPSATPANRYFGFSHVLDTGWTGNHYPRSWELLGLAAFDPIVNVDKTPAPYQNTRRLITDADVKNDPNRAHGTSMPGGSAVKDSMGKYIHEDVWRYLFTHPVDDSQTRTVSGWTVHINGTLLTQSRPQTERALTLLQSQLETIRRVVPGSALVELQKVPLYFSPEYPGTPPRAEYHPNLDWLLAHNRDPAMARAIEFTNIRIFEQECRRMPIFALHELAHAYHDRVLGSTVPALDAAYARAKASGTYAHVEHRDAQGRKSFAPSYALTNVQEYFAEASEAFFGQNDIFPYNRSQLQKHDPTLSALLPVLWNHRA